MKKTKTIPQDDLTSSSLFPDASYYPLMAVGFSHENDKYSVYLGKGSNTNETAFCVMVIIRALMRDGIIKSPQDMLDLISKYCNDSQYEEIKGENK